MNIKKEKYGFVYIWRDSKYKRYYIGAHWGYEDDGYVCSSPWMNRCYQERPLDFKRRIIENNINDREKLFERELYWLSMVNPEEIKPLNNNPKYYNLNIRHNEHWLKYPDYIKTIGEKISFKKKGKTLRPCSKETKEKIRQATKGVKKTYTEESYRRLVDNVLGRKHTQEWKDERSKIVKEQWKNGIRKAKEFLTEEHKKKLSDVRKGKIYYQPTEESRKKQSEARKALWANPEYREKMTKIRNERKKIKYKKEIINL
jgi:hypothetical protein